MYKNMQNTSSSWPGKLEIWANLKCMPGPVQILVASAYTKFNLKLKHSSWILFALTAALAIVTVTVT